MVLYTIAFGLVVGAVLLGPDDRDTTAIASDAATEFSQLVPVDSQRLSTGSSGVIFVEFLDFECEACLAAHPLITELRDRYAQEVTFVVRNFPLHPNSEAAARAAEAAAAQGQYEAMYNLLFETQSEWDGTRTPQEGVFFELAEQLGLDIDAFRSAFDDPATLERIRRDKADGEALGVTGTPTFFLDGEMLELDSFDELVELIDHVLEEG